MIESTSHSVRVSGAIRYAQHLLKHDPSKAIEQLTGILGILPQHPPALPLKVSAHEKLEEWDKALSIIQPLVMEHLKWRDAHLTLAKKVAKTG